MSPKRAQRRFSDVRVILLNKVPSCTSFSRIWILTCLNNNNNSTKIKDMTKNMSLVQPFIIQHVNLRIQRTVFITSIKDSSMQDKNLSFFLQTVLSLLTGMASNSKIFGNIRKSKKCHEIRCQFWPNCRRFVIGNDLEFPWESTSYFEQGYYYYNMK